MTVRALIVVGLVAIAGSTWQSAETWLLPKKFAVQSNEKVSIKLKTGDSFIGADQVLAPEKITKFEWRHLKSVTNLKPNSTADLELAMQAQGSHVLAFQSTPAYREYDAETFNEYISDYALDDASYYRRTNKLIDTPGKETFINYAKLYLQVGKDHDETFKTPVGFPLEVMLLEDPSSLKVGSKISVKILFEGKPLFGVRVKVWNRYQNRTSMQPIFTQQDGVIESHISTPGPWMVSVVKMVKSKDDKADWLSYCSTLTFGVQ